MRRAHGHVAERAAVEEVEAEQKRQKEEQLAEQRRQRELERAAAAEEARKKALREEEAAERAKLRSQQAKTAPAAATGEGAWRRTAAQTSVPPRAQSPAPTPSPVSATGPPKIGGAPGSWRQREKEKQAGAPAGAATSPATTNAPLPDTKKDTDGFETVSEKKVWKPSRLRGTT